MWCSRWFCNTPLPIISSFEAVYYFIRGRREWLLLGIGWFVLFLSQLIVLKSCMWWHIDKQVWFWRWELLLLSTLLMDRYRIWNEFSFHTVFMKRVVCFITPSLWWGDIEHTKSFINTVSNENSLSHDNSEKYQYSMKKVIILIKFRAKIALQRRALRDVIMFLLMMSLAKERETAEKSVM